MAHFDVIIIGGGIVGAACARTLAADHRRVLLLEAGVFGGGATAAGMGHIVVMDDSEAQFALTSHSRALWNALAPELPQGADVLPAGTLWVASDQEEMDAVHQKAAFYKARSVAVEVLDQRQLRAEEPNLREGLAGGLRVRDDSVVYPPVIASWLIERASEAGARAMQNAPVAAISPPRVTLRDGREFHAPCIINAAGAWSTELTRGLPIRRRKGHLVITDRYPSFARHQIIELGYLKNAHASDEDSVSFNIQPRGTGQMLLGSSRQFDPVDQNGNVVPLGSEVEPRMVARMVQRAREYMPAIDSLKSIRTWAGFRAATPDSLPLIGPHPSIEGLWIAAGHEGLGITTSLGTADLLASQITGRACEIDPRPYLPGRDMTHH